ncbi:MAG: hypothetical protein H6713_20040 [Myxococcales bacterium]|nr:hypothetical protein [Myxococcales bacterium]MCB9752253.1 hypothetical protein [Myxococcales bacterium]
MNRTGSARRSRVGSRAASTLAIAAALLLGFGAPACKKDGDSAAPGSKGAAKDPKGGGVTLRYNTAARTLKKNIKGSFTVTSGRGGGSISADLSGQLDFTDNGEGTLKVSYKVLELRDYKSEMPQPEAGEGGEQAGPPPDPKAVAQSVTGAVIINDRGEPDEDKTKALPENKRDENADPQVQSIHGMVEGMLGVPELPDEALEVGKPVSKSEEKEIPSPMGMKIPSEIDTTIKLISIDESTGKRLATVEVEVEGGGAVEAQGNMISMESSATQTTIFNLDDQIPVSTKVTSTNAYTFGTQGSFELSFNYEASFEPG